MPLGRKKAALALAAGGLRLYLQSMLRRSVLIVDDDDDNLLVLAASLELDFEVKTARSCREARALLASTTFDALITDFSLGDGTALELVASLGDRRPPVSVLVTGYGSAEDQARSHAAGFHAHLVKPITIPELERTLRTAFAPAAIAVPL